jgi:hypothetical protein
MKIEFTERQKTIVNSLRLKGSKESQKVLGELESGRLTMADIEGLCNLINDEFMMEGILPSFEPNVYGRELEALLDLVNSARIRS